MEFHIHEERHVHLVGFGMTVEGTSSGGVQGRCSCLVRLGACNGPSKLLELSVRRGKCKRITDFNLWRGFSESTEKNIRERVVWVVACFEAFEEPIDVEELIFFAGSEAAYLMDADSDQVGEASQGVGGAGWDIKVQRQGLLKECGGDASVHKGE